MKTLVAWLSDWWSDRTAALEDRTEQIVVPPTDQMFDRLAAWCATTQRRLQSSPWLRKRTRGV
jgi:hypothetical protein